MEELKQCPCGKTPAKLGIINAGQGDKWAWAYVIPSCCGEWAIEFHTKCLDQASQECMEIAEDAWNKSPRGWKA